MKRMFFKYAAMTLPGLAVGLLIGLSLGGGGGDLEETDLLQSKRELASNSRSATRSGTSAAAPLTRNAQKGADIRERLLTASSAEIPGLLHEVLSISDHPERTRSMIALFDHVDDSNVAEVMAQFGKVVEETGQKDTQSYHMALFLAGQKAGLAMLKEWESQGVAESGYEIHESLFGLASVDSDAAADWANRVGEAHPEKIVDYSRCVVGGVTVSDPQKGSEYWLSLPADMQEASVGDLQWHLIAASGLDAAIERFGAFPDTAAGEGEKSPQEMAVDNLLPFIGDEFGGVLEPAVVAARLAKVDQYRTLDFQDVSAIARKLPMEVAMEVAHEWRLAKPSDEAGLSPVEQASYRFNAARQPREMLAWLAQHEGSDKSAQSVAPVISTIRAAGHSQKVELFHQNLPEGALKNQISELLSQE